MESQRVHLVPCDRELQGEKCINGPWALLVDPEPTAAEPRLLVRFRVHLSRRERHHLPDGGDVCLSFNHAGVDGGGANAILQNSKLLTNLKFPRLILPMANLLEALMVFTVSLGVLLVAPLVLDFYVAPSSLLILLAVIPLHFILNLGLSSIAARLVVQVSS